MPKADREIQVKLKKLGEFLDRHNLDGVFLTQRANFAWITGGKDNHVFNASPNGVAGILATPTSRICFTTNIEEPRFRNEELKGDGIEIASFIWHDSASATKALRDLIAGRRVAADMSDSGEFDRFGAGFVKLPDEFAQLRWVLDDAEIARYREGGKRTARAIEDACRTIKRGMTEHQIAGVLDDHIRVQGLTPVLALVAVDDRTLKYRHPIPTDLKVKRYAMLVTCAVYKGLISNVTRLVSFTKLTPELKKKQQAVCNVDTAMNLSTRPGKTLGDIFMAATDAYGFNGFMGEQTLHHQGGPTGYAGREAFAVPGLPIKIQANQAFAWNPSIAGVKSEDTMLCTEKGIEFFTKTTPGWPKLKAHYRGQSLDRPDILLR